MGVQRLPHVVALDSDVCSLLFKGRLDESAVVRLEGAAWVVSFVTVAELLRWAESRAWGAAARQRLHRWLDGVRVIDSDGRICTHWAEIVTFAERRGRPRPVNDSWIAACCLARQIPLVTRNVKDFIDFAEHEGLELIPV